MANPLTRSFVLRRRPFLALLFAVLTLVGGAAAAQPYGEADAGQRLRLTPEQRRDLWERMTPEQREALRNARNPQERQQRLWGEMSAQQRGEVWKQLSPEQRELMLRRLPPEQRRDMWRGMSPDERDTMRQRFVERRGEWRGEPNPEWQGRGPRGGRSMSPEERHQLRQQIEEARRDIYQRRPERRGRR